MRIEPFEMERWQSTWEHRVDYNLSESGVHPLSVAELLALPGSPESPLPDLDRIRLGYAQGNGAEPLRERVARLYPGAEPDQVLITHGGAEANFLTTLRLVEPGDEVVMMLPNYMQTHGLAGGWGGRLRPWPMNPDDNWEPDPAALDDLVGPRTRLIIITNPNNPTGRVLGDPLLEAVASAAERSGAWVLSDEIYRGAEREGSPAPTMWGRYDRLVITSGLSKAYGLPGLRTGWAVTADRGLSEALWSYHDYSTICPSPLTEALALYALDPERREQILARTREIINRNLPLLIEWLQRRPEMFTYTPGEAGAILWIRYHLAVGSSDLAERVRAEQSTLIVPGDQFGQDRYLRLGFGTEPDYLLAGLERLYRVLQTYEADGPR